METYEKLKEQLRQIDEQLENQVKPLLVQYLKEAQDELLQKQYPNLFLQNVAYTEQAIYIIYLGRDGINFINPHKRGISGTFSIEYYVNNLLSFHEISFVVSTVSEGLKLYQEKYTW